MQMKISNYKINKSSLFPISSSWNTNNFNQSNHDQDKIQHMRQQKSVQAS